MRFLRFAPLALLALFLVPSTASAGHGHSSFGISFGYGGGYCGPSFGISYGYGGGHCGPSYGVGIGYGYSSCYGYRPYNYRTWNGYYNAPVAYGGYCGTGYSNYCAPVAYARPYYSSYSYSAPTYYARPAYTVASYSSYSYPRYSTVNYSSGYAGYTAPANSSSNRNYVAARPVVVSSPAVASSQGYTSYYRR